MAELVLDEPLSFWGGLDPATGMIIDLHHPQYGESIAGRSLVMDRTRGSTSSTAVLAEAIRLGNGPRAIRLAVPDMTVIAAVHIAAILYDLTVDLEIGY